MKRFWILTLVVMIFAACAKDTTNEQQGIYPTIDDAPERLVAEFEDCAETRIQLNEAQKTVWTKGDMVSVFYRSDANQKWQYTGETGERTAELTRVDVGVATETMNRVVVVYPYNENYYINTETHNIEATLPAVQHYLEGSYGLDGNIMVSSSEFNQVSLKSIYGWLKLQITGDGDIIKSITLRGNDGEQVAGVAYIDSNEATMTLASEMGGSDDSEAGGAGGVLIFDDTIFNEVTLDCGGGVALTDEVETFYIALPPQEFKRGITVEIEDANGYVLEKSTENVIIIERNHIQPMKAFEFIGADTPERPANNQICYTATAIVEPFSVEDFDVTLLSNIFDDATGQGVMTFDGDVTKIGAKAFEKCKNLISVTLPNGVTTLGERAFFECSAMESIDIPEGVTTIGNNAFYNCDALITIVIPEGVTKISSGLFHDCNNLASVVIPEGVITIGERAFQACNLSSVTLPDSLTTIGSYAFYNCKSMTSIDFGEGVETINQYALYNCAAITSITLPKSITTISNFAFFSCKGLANLYCKATTPPSLENYSLYGTASDLVIYVPTGSVEAYKAAEVWSKYAEIIVGDDAM